VLVRVLNSPSVLPEEAPECGNWDVCSELGSTVAQWLALPLHSARDPGTIPGWVTVCVEFAHSPLLRLCVGFLRVLRFPPTVPKDVVARPREGD